MQYAIAWSHSQARWMAKAIYAVKMELLLEGNEALLHMTDRELQALQRLNRFVVLSTFSLG